MNCKADRPFRFFIAGQGVVGFGESIRFIAVTVLIYNLTGSGISAATGVALSTLPGILISPFAGVLGDRSPEDRILIWIDLIRFLITPLFLLAERIAYVYLLLILISILDVLYNPAKRKFILVMTGSKNAVKANSMLTGVNGAAYLAGSFLTGYLTDRCGHAPAIIIAAGCCFISALMTRRCMVDAGDGRRIVCGREDIPSMKRESIRNEFNRALKYCRTDHRISELLCVGIVIGFCTLSVNLSFYPYAFDLLKVTARGWGLMISIYYGTNLLAMLLVRCSEKRLDGHEAKIFYACLTVASLIWLLYAFTGDYGIVLLLQLTEGTLLAGCAIILSSRFQRIIEKRYMARISALNEIITSIGKLAGMASMVLIMCRLSFREVFILSSIIMVLFAGFGFVRPQRWGQ